MRARCPTARLAPRNLCDPYMENARATRCVLPSPFCARFAQAADRQSLLFNYYTHTATTATTSSTTLRERDGETSFPHVRAVRACVRARIHHHLCTGRRTRTRPSVRDSDRHQSARATQHKTRPAARLAVEHGYFIIISYRIGVHACACACACERCLPARYFDVTLIYRA